MSITREEVRAAFEAFLDETGEESVSGPRLASWYAARGYRGRPGYNLGQRFGMYLRSLADRGEIVGTKSGWRRPAVASETTLTELQRTIHEATSSLHYEHERPITVAELVDATGLPRGTVAAGIRGACARGVLARRGTGARSRVWPAIAEERDRLDPTGDTPSRPSSRAEAP